MKTVACKDVSGMSCDFVAMGENDEDVKQKLMEHGSQMHSAEMQAMSDDQKNDMMQKIDSSLATQM